MDLLMIFGWALIIYPVLFRIAAVIVCGLPLRLEINAGKRYAGGNPACFRNVIFKRLNVAAMVLGVLILILVRDEPRILFPRESLFVLTTVSLSLILIPCLEVAYYRWRIEFPYRGLLNVLQMREYHKLNGIYEKHPFSLKGSIHRKLRFFMLSAGLLLLLISTI